MLGRVDIFRSDINRGSNGLYTCVRPECARSQLADQLQYTAHWSYKCSDPVFWPQRNVSHIIQKRKTTLKTWADVSAFVWVLNKRSVSLYASLTLYQHWSLNRAFLLCRSELLAKLLCGTAVVQRIMHFWLLKWLGFYETIWIVLIQLIIQYSFWCCCIVLKGVCFHYSSYNCHWCERLQCSTLSQYGKYRIQVK